MTQIITGFHAIEEKVRRAVENGKNDGLSISYSKIGPRVKKILELASSVKIPCAQVDNKDLDALVQKLPEIARDHRGIALCVEGANENQTKVDFESWIASQKVSNANATVLILDSITDPHNIGAILRSADQFGASLVVMPKRNSANVSDNEIIARASAGAVSYVPVSVVSNLSRAVQKLKEAGFWIYGADAGGKSVTELKFPEKTCIIMGSEGTGISSLLEKQCDVIASIPTCGNIDSLNVSVAAGVLLYEVYRQRL